MILTNTGQFPIPARRIVSLVPSQTELLHFLGLEEETIGITKFCIHPTSWASSKIRVGGTKNIDIQLIEKMNPDLIIANKEENVRTQVEVLALHFPVWLTDVNNLEDAYQMIADIGALTGKDNEAYNLNKEIEDKFSAMPQFRSLRACYLIWKDPYMVAGSHTFTNDMMERAGLLNVFRDKSRYPVVSLEDIEHATPDVILLSSEPYPFAQKHIDDLNFRLPGIKKILVDGEMFSWYGSRLLKVPGYFTTIFPGIQLSS